MSKPPIVIVHDLKSFAIEDTPQEFIDALEAELVGYADMTPHQKLIVKGSQTIAGSVPNDLSGDDLVQWLNEMSKNDNDTDDDADKAAIRERMRQPAVARRIKS